MGRVNPARSVSLSMSHAWLRTLSMKLLLLAVAKLTVWQIHAERGIAQSIELMLVSLEAGGWSASAPDSMLIRISFGSPLDLHFSTASPVVLFVQHRDATAMGLFSLQGTGRGWPLGDHGSGSPFLELAEFHDVPRFGLSSWRSAVHFRTFRCFQTFQVWFLGLLFRWSPSEFPRFGRNVTANWKLDFFDFLVF